MITAFIGDAERTLHLTPDMTVALEKYVRKPVGELYQNFAQHRAYVSDLFAIIFHGLIGGGMDDRAAFDLVETYIRPRPVMQNWRLAFDVLEYAWSGETVSDDIPDASEPEAA